MLAVSSSDSEAAETEVEGSSNPRKHDTSDDEPGDAYACGSSATSKGWSDIPSVLLSRLLQPKIMHLSGFSRFLTFKSETNIVLCKKVISAWNDK